MITLAFFFERMENQEYINRKIAFRGISLLLVLSTIAILSTLFVVVFQFNELRSLCVCISNYLAWGWIGFGISIILGLAGLTSAFSSTSNNTFQKVMLILQSIAFFAGIFLIVLFGSFLLKVI